VPGPTPLQLELRFDGNDPGRRTTAEGFLARLRTLGLRRISQCTLTANRSTMVSFRDRRLRVQRAFLDAPHAVLQAVVAFVNGPRAARRAARRTLLAFRPPLPPSRAPARQRVPEVSRPEDVALIARLGAEHRRLNGERFAGVLSPVAIRISRRMRTRLGHYSPSVPGGAPEIAIGFRHVRRDGWQAACETLAHEMVHQWQHETGRPIAHDRAFRTKARAIGIAPSARRRSADEPR
jgi:hypothetical protein